MHRATDSVRSPLHSSEKPLHQGRSDSPLHHCPFGDLSCECQTAWAIARDVNGHVRPKGLKIQPPMRQSNHLAVHVHGRTAKQLTDHGHRFTHSLRRLATPYLHFRKASDTGPQTQHGSPFCHFIYCRDGHSRQRWMACVRVGHHRAELDVLGMHSSERQARVHFTKKALISIPKRLIATCLLEPSEFDQARWRIFREVQSTHADVHVTISTQPLLWSELPPWA